MTFTETRTFTDSYGNPCIAIDGYTKAKTLKGILTDLQKEVLKVSVSEANNLTVENVKETIGMHSEDNAYSIEIEEVACASRITEDETMEYADASNYVYFTFMI